MKSRVCEILNIKYPLFQGGMAWVADANLAAAVSNAGGLGIITSMSGSVESVREEIRKCKTLTDNPFAVNLMLQIPYAAEVADLIVEEGVKIVTTGAGSPAPYIEKWKAAGITVVAVVASVAFAKKMEEIGVDIVVAEGAEAGGHVGETHTMSLVPQIVDAVSIPVVAAGGICDRRGAAAAFMLGAEGIQVGTRFLVAEESKAHPDYKEKLLKAGDISTIVTGKTLGHPVRALKTPFSRKFAKMEADPNVTPEEIMAFGTGAYRKAVFDGDKNGSYMAGECAGLVTKIEPAKTIVEDLILGAEKVIKQWIEKN